MSLYLFMGTNMPEMACCLDYLADFERESDSTSILVPVGLEESFKHSTKAKIVPYEPAANNWGCLEKTEERTFILIDPRISPVPQLEALSARLENLGVEPDKISTMVDCLAAEKSPQLRVFLEASIYYSDIVLLGTRQEASKAFPRSYQKEFERKCFPCLFLLLKGKGLPNDPVELLTPGVRRITQLFDLSENEQLTESGPKIEASCDLELEEMEMDPYRVSEDSPAPDAMVPDVSQWIVL